MTDLSVWVKEATASMARLVGQFIEYLPTLMGVFAILIVGWIAAGLLKRLTRRVLHGFNSVVEHNVDWSAARGMRLSATAIGLIASTVFWVILLFFVTVATGTLGLDAFSVWLTKMIEYLPAAVAGTVIIVIGFIISTWLREGIVNLATNAGVGQATSIGQIAQVVVVLTAVVLGIEQIGIDTALLVNILTIALGAVLGGMALAFGLGSRDLVANMIGAHHAGRQFGPGDRVKIDDIEGVVTQITPTYLLVEGKNGTARIPGMVFQRQAFVISGGKSDG